jgi:hypothetical protein
MRKSNMPRVLTMNFDETSYDTLEKLRNELGKSSKVAVIRSALQLLKTTKELQQDGGKLILKSKDGVEREVVLI